MSLGRTAQSQHFAMHTRRAAPRLDTFTTGVLVLSRHKAANHAFKEALQDKAGSAVGKVYKVKGQPRILLPAGGWHCCQLY